MAWPNSWKMRFDIAMRHERRFVAGGRWEIADQARRSGVDTSRSSSLLAFDDAELREVIVFAFAREHVEIEQAERLAGFRVTHAVELEVADPFIRRGERVEFAGRRCAGKC